MHTDRSGVRMCVLCSLQRYTIWVWTVNPCMSSEITFLKELLLVWGRNSGKAINEKQCSHFRCRTIRRHDKPWAHSWSCIYFVIVWFPHAGMTRVCSAEYVFVRMEIDVSTWASTLVVLCIVSASKLSYATLTGRSSVCGQTRISPLPYARTDAWRHAQSTPPSVSACGEGTYPGVLRCANAQSMPLPTWAPSITPYT